MKVIQITAVVLGDSKCYWSSCCIKDSDCTRNPNEKHRTDVRRRCDNKRSCSVDVLKEWVDCGVLGPWSPNDFERITYDCRNDPRNKTMDSTAAADEDQDSESTVNSYLEQVNVRSGEGTAMALYSRNANANGGSNAKPTTDGHSLLLPLIVMSVISTVLLSGFSALGLVVFFRRKKQHTQKSLNSCERSLEAPTIDYCEINGADEGRIPCDNDEYLVHGRNYEPLIVYEELQGI